MVDGLTYDDFARLMQRYEPGCTQADVDRGWAAWCCRRCPNNHTRSNA